MAYSGGPNPFFAIPPSDAVWARGGPEASQDLFWDLLRPHLGTSGGLCGSVCCLLSFLFSLLSSLFSRCCSFPRSLFALVTSNFASGHRTRPQQTLSVELLLFRTRTFGPLYSLLSALFSPFPLLSLLLISQIALSTCHFELCIRPSNPLPTASTLCGTIPGPAECAKR